MMAPDNRELSERIWRAFSYQVPRILTQLDRDPDSPTYGSFDRDYWHYKMRDFSSMILQQGMVVLEILRTLELPGNMLYQNPLVRKWVDAGMDFWAAQQLSNGAFNEYYPFEAGYPPTAFSLYAVGLVYMERGFPAPPPNHANAINKAIAWLLSNQEKQALNQEAAGLAAIAICKRIPGIVLDNDRYESRLDIFFSVQSAEGWFPEYGGPDLGYLSVTIDCLWDYYLCTKDERGLEAATKASRFIAVMVSVSGQTPVMINSRNTDYIVPYGLACLGRDDTKTASIVRALYGSIEKPDHFIHSTDDRYACHYIHQSIARSLAHTSSLAASGFELPCQERFDHFFTDCGVYVKHLAGKESIYVACKKGGIVYIFSPDGVQRADFGYRTRLSDHSIAVTHWQDDSYQVDYNASETAARMSISGQMSAHPFVHSTPLRHIALRLLSFTFGNRLIPFLKKAMIFRARVSKLAFSREVIVSDCNVEINDTFQGDPSPISETYSASQYSLRHVASACRFSSEELLPELEDVTEPLSSKERRRILSLDKPLI